MKLFIHFLLISSFSIIIIDGIYPLPTESQIESIIQGNQAAITGLPEIIQLSEGGLISREKYTMVWKGTYHITTDVAIKITNIRDSFHIELEAYEKLNATNDDFDFEKYGIPKVYHNGTIFDNYYATVMTLCHESLEKRFELQRGNFSDSTLLLIFTQLAKTLQYFHSKKVWHNAIEPKNILFRGPNVFVVDFKSSHLQYKPNSDYISMVCMIWKLAGAHEYDIEQWDFCSRKHIKDPDVRKAFASIVEMRYVCGEAGNYDTPNFGKIIEAANQALVKIGKKPEQVQFDWLKNDPHGSTDDSHGSKRYSLGFFRNRFRRDSSGASSSSKTNTAYRRLNND